MRCAACGGDVRKTKRALVVPGRFVRRVCLECFARGIVVVAKTTPTQEVKRVVRDDAVDQTIRMLRTYASAARDSGLEGRAEGIETAIETLERNAS